MKLEPSPGTAPRREPGHGHNELTRLHRVVPRTVQQSGQPGRRGVPTGQPEHLRVLLICCGITYVVVRMMP
jgi:hypothetical protein